MAIVVAGVATLATSQGTSRVSGSMPLSIALTADAAIAIREFEITYDATKVPSADKAAVVINVPEIDDRTRVIVMPLDPAEVGSRRNLRLEDDGTIFNSQAHCPRYPCVSRIRVVFELLDVSAPLTLSGTVEWRVNVMGQATPGPNPMTVEMSEPQAKSLAVASQSATTGPQSARLTEDAFVVIYDAHVSFDLGEVSDEAAASAVLASVRIRGPSLDAHGEAPATVTVHEPPLEYGGTGGVVVDGNPVAVRPISGCTAGAACERTFRLTFKWTGAKDVVEFDWELVSSIIAYGAQVPKDAATKVTIAKSWAVPADAPRVEASLKGDFEVARRGDQAREIVDYKANLSERASGEAGDPMIPAFSYLTLRAVQDPGAAPSAEILHFNVQNVGEAHVPLDGTPVTLAFDPIRYCEPGGGCKEDGILVFFRQNEIGDGRPIRIEWDLTLRAASFGGTPLPADATIGIEPREVNR